MVGEVQDWAAQTLRPDDRMMATSTLLNCFNDSIQNGMTSRSGTNEFLEVDDAAAAGKGRPLQSEVLLSLVEILTAVYCSYQADLCWTTPLRRNEVQLFSDTISRRFPAGHLSDFAFCSPL